VSGAAWLQPALTALAGLLLAWLVLVVTLWVVARRRHDAVGLREAVRLLPDLLRLLRRLAADPALPRGVRVGLVLGVGYLLLPVDLVPDVVPVLGWADDAVVVALLLRAVVRRAGPDALARHWPGTPAGLAAVLRLAGATARGPGEDRR
jgi:uncharacterized membrane protein YkvA (DUF1232 family)